MIDIKRAVKKGQEDKKCCLEYIRDGAIWYRTPNGELFPVPFDDTGSATFHVFEKPMYLMRWMRKWNESKD